MSMKDHMSRAANQQTPPTDVPEEGDATEKAYSNDERMESAQDFIGRIIFFPNSYAFSGSAEAKHPNQVELRNAAYLITNEIGGQAYWGHLLTLAAVKTPERIPVTLDKVWQRNNSQPLLDKRAGSMQVRFGGTTPVMAFFTAQGLNLEGGRTTDIPHQGISVTTIRKSYDALHSVVSELGDQNFIPVYGQQKVGAVALNKALRTGSGILCPLTMPNLLDMDAKETAQVVKEATKHLRHPIITDKSMIFTV